MKSRKETIKSCAARLFRKKGYKATSMREIAKAVGIEAPSIYNHIKSKEELLRDLLLEMAHLFTKGMKEVNNCTLNPMEKMEKLIDLHVRLTVEHTDAIALIAGEWVHLKDPALQEYISLRDSYELAFKNIIEAGKTTGFFKDIDTDIVLFSILSTLRWLYTWYGKNKTYNLVELERQMKHCLIDGIKK